MNPSKTVATRPAAIDKNVLDALAACSVNASSAFALATSHGDNIVAALTVADSIQDLRDLFDKPEVRKRIEALQDTPLGFRTDKDPKVWNNKKNALNQPYDWVIVREASIEALLRGLQLVGNQFNIIAGRFYATKEAFKFLCGSKVKGLTNFKPTFGVPKVVEGQTVVLCKATWKMNGVDDALDAYIPIKTDDYSTADQTLGKAERKFLARCYAQMSGNILSEGDATEPAEQIEAKPIAPVERKPRTVKEPPPPPTEPRNVSPPKSELFPAVDDYEKLRIAIMECGGTLAEFVDGLEADNQLFGAKKADIKEWTDIPITTVKTYAGKAGDFVPAVQTVQFIQNYKAGRTA